MSKKVALLSLGATSPLLLGALFFEGTAARLILAVCVAIQPAALLVLGASRRGGLGPLRFFVPGLFFWYLGILAMLVEPPQAFREWTLAGLPFLAILMLGGLWLVPMLFVTVAYVATFSGFALREEDLRKIRAARRELESNASR